MNVLFMTIGKMDNIEEHTTYCFFRLTSILPPNTSPDYTPPTPSFHG